MKEADPSPRSFCPVNYAVETIGDRWSLLILRDMIFWGRQTYSDFLKAEEGIATNILANRLAYLEREGLITKSKDRADRRRDIYKITEKGLEFVPTMLEMIAWSAKRSGWQSLDHQNATIEQWFLVNHVAKSRDKSDLADKIKEIVRRGGSVFSKDPAALTLKFDESGVFLPAQE